MFYCARTLSHTKRKLVNYMKKNIAICLLLIMVLSLSACGSDDESEGMIFDTFDESVFDFVETENGGTAASDANILKTVAVGEEKEYSLIRSTDKDSGDEVFYLLRTMELEEKFITDKVSENATLSDELTEDKPYMATSFSYGDEVFFVLVRVMDGYTVTCDGEDCESPEKNLYVTAGETEPEIQIVKKGDSE